MSMSISFHGTTFVDFDLNGWVTFINSGASVTFFMPGYICQEVAATAKLVLPVYEGSESEGVSLANMHTVKKTAVIVFSTFAALRVYDDKGNYISLFFTDFKTALAIAEAFDL